MAILDDGTYAVRNGNLYKIELPDPVFKGAKEYHIVLKKESNADRIRNMTDEELAEFMERTKFYVCKKVAEICGIYNLEEHWDKDGIVKEEIEWLKQEADE